ncbi:SymE family type I addiction module toxin [Pragia fontium]
MKHRDVRERPPPAINLKSRWLEELGFFSGQGQLVIQRELQV